MLQPLARVLFIGMLTPSSYSLPDLTDPGYESHPPWSIRGSQRVPLNRAQPNRYMSHNGEINTLRGNQNWLTARQSVVASPPGDDMSKLFPLVEPDFSDSGTFDNALEFLLLSGRSLQEAVMMMIPAGRPQDDGSRQAGFLRVSLRAHGALGWSSIDCLHDGRAIGAVLDRNV